MSTRHSIVAASAFFALLWAPAAASAADSCNGDACSILTASSTGCAWTNKGDKPVRLSVSSPAAGAVLAILAPGQTFKEPDKARCAGDVVPRLDASFVTLPKVADEAPAKPKPVPKPKPKVVPGVPAVAAAPAATAAVAVPASAPAVAPVKVAAVATMPLPRAKPAVPAPYPPMPRVKPEAPVVTAQATVAAVAPAAAVAAAEPAPSAASSPASGAASCGDSCPPILFKVFDNCLWVLNLNPRPVRFEADAAGRKIALALEAADGAKADARAEAMAKGGAPKDEAALHMRFRDPFQSAGSGIPLYRARLGSASNCIKSRAEIATFSASFEQ